MIQIFSMIWHGITPLKKLILQIQTTTETIKLIGYLILGEIKYWNLENEQFKKKNQKSWKHNNFTFHGYLAQYPS